MRIRYIVVMRWGAVIGVCCALAPASASAQPSPRVSVVYTPAPRCPDAALFRAMVASRLGYDGDSPSSAGRAVLSVQRARGGFWRGRLEVTTAAGEALPPRERSHRDCRALVDGLLLTLAIQQAQDPPRDAPALERVQNTTTRSTVLVEATPARDPPRSITAAVDDETAIGPRPPALPVLPPGRGLSFRVQVELHASLGATPDFSGGGTLGVGLRWRALSVAVEGRMDVPTYLAIGEGFGFDVGVVLGGLALCGHPGRWVVCGLGLAGVQRVTSVGLPSDQVAVLPWYAVGARFGYELPLARRLLLRAQAEVTALPSATQVTFDGQTQWSSPPVAALLGLALIADLH